jgi:hypothetical protein
MPAVEKWTLRVAMFAAIGAPTGAVAAAVIATTDDPEPNCAAVAERVLTSQTSILRQRASI